MTREERLEAEVAEVRKEARELREAFHAAYRHKDRRRWIYMLNDYINEMEWWQWLFLGLVCGLGFGFGLFS